MRTAAGSCGSARGPACRAPGAINIDDATDDASFYASLTQVFDALPSEVSAPLLTELRRVHALSDRRGIDALLNASEHPEPVREDFASMRNDSERAL